MKDSLFIKRKLIKSPWFAGQFTIWVHIWILSFIIALLLTYTSLQPDVITQFSYLINGIALFFGGFSAGKISGKKGWYYGGLQGIIYSLILLMISFLGFDQPISTSSILLILFAFITSAFGGIIGVNIKKTQVRRPE